MSALALEIPHGPPGPARVRLDPRRLLAAASLLAAILAPWLLIVATYRGFPEAAACFLGSPPA